MATTFIDAVRDCLKAHGYAKKKEEQESGGTFLVGYRGRLFFIDDDYQVGEAADGYNAVGCGLESANGAMFASPHVPARQRVRTALEAAERFSAGVRGPFNIVNLKGHP
jgi:hypothetical protein